MGKTRKIECITTGEFFASVVEAAKAHCCHQSSISWVLSGRMKSCKGNVYRYADEPNKQANKPITSKHTWSKMPIGKKAIRDGKKVYCRTNDKAYMSALEAAITLGINPDGVYNACQGRQDTAYGLRFAYFENLSPEEKKLADKAWAKRERHIKERRRDELFNRIQADMAEYARLMEELK